MFCRDYLAMMTEEQIDRYEAFRRSSLQKASMRKVTMMKHPPKAPNLFSLRTCSHCCPDIATDF